MATEVYKVDYVHTIDGVEIEISPLKIKYMRKFMTVFESMSSNSQSEDDVINYLSECVRICMEQYNPDLAESVDAVQDSFDLDTIYKIIDLAAGIKIKGQKEKEEDAEEETSNGAGNSWGELDLAKLESEAFCLGIWKNYTDLESSLSLQELMAIISSRRELDYDERKFAAAIQGIDLDANSSDGEVKGQQEWENLKARVASGGATNDANDILALQGKNAQQAGFGIGMGLGYEDLRDPAVLVQK